MVVTRPFVLWLCLVLSLGAHAGSARMTLAVAKAVEADADYWPGEADRPAVLILHGFLQTREFPTVRRLAEALADEGYTVLLPSLSLGINRRQRNLACEAIHTHSMQQDVDELRAWVDWLNERSGKPPVLVGHSSGAVQVAALLKDHGDVAVASAVLLSPPYFGEGQGPDRLELLRARAETDLARNPHGLAAYPLTFCRKYVTGPAQLLSYLAWDKAALGTALVDLSVPLTVIYGEGDLRVDRPWIEGLRAGGVAVRSIDGAGHFFGAAHEFALLDEVLAVLDGGMHG